MSDLDRRVPVPPERVNVGVIAFSQLDEQGVIRYVMDSLAANTGGWICPVNTEVLRQCTRDDDLRALVGSADLVIADGAPIVLASRVARKPLAGRVAGSTLLFTLSRAAAQQGHTVFLLGGAPGTGEGAARRLQSETTTLTVAGVDCPPLGFEVDEAQMERVSGALLGARPDIVFVGLGFPKQDRFIAEARAQLPQAWFVSCGISFSFASGSVARAPRWLQVAGLEWAHRLVQEPRRLFRRYIVHGIPFAIRLLVLEAIRKPAHSDDGLV